MTHQGQPLELVPGEILDGKYRVERLLGVGGMGAVYVAERLALRDHVAIKSILSSQNTPTNRARFLREARAAASIRHPNVVKIFDFGEPRGRPPYMVMELLEGPTLGTVVREAGPLALSRALWIFSGICAAIEAGHRRGVIHRDLKPGNVIMARSDDGRETVKVLDFGLARVIESESSLTSPGAMLGTCSYMAPELIESSESSTASDVYALGVLLYEMVVGRSPFRADTTAATILKITRSEYEPPLQAMPELPQEVAAGIEAALFKSSSQRPRSPEELAARVGAPLAQSASELDAHRLRAVHDLSASAVGAPAELEPSMVSVGVEIGEVTTTDAGPNLDGGERTMSGEDEPDPHATSVFVGRARELETLRRGYRLALDGRGRIAVVTGDAGVGKSRLVESFVGWAKGQGAVTLHGRFFAYEGDHPPPYETFLWMLGTPASSSSHAGAPLGGGGNRPGVGDVAGPSEDKWHTFARLADAFATRSRGRPLVLSFDDLQWATMLDLEFLAYLPRAVDHATIMVVGTGRESGDASSPGYLGKWLARLGSQRALTNVRLGGFSTGAVRAWFQACFPGIRMRPHDVRKLEHATAGNPYFLAEVVGHLVDAGSIRKSKQGWACASLDRVELPETVNTVVRARLEGLDDELRGVLEMACVLGEEFRFETLLAALGRGFDDEDALEALLEKAVARRVLSDEGLAPGSDYRFENSTIRSVLYGQLAKRKRRRLHQAVVEAMGELYGDEDAARIAKVLAYHYDAVGDHANTLKWGLLAAEETLSRYDNDHADASLERALAAAEAMQTAGEEIDAATLGRLDLATGALYVRIGRLDDAAAVLERALARESATEIDPVVELDILLERAACQLAQGELTAGLQTGQAAIMAAQRVGDHGRELDARLHAARCAAPHGDLDQAVELLDPVAAAQGTRYAALRSMAKSELAWVCCKRGAFDRAVSLTHEALEDARATSNAAAEYRAVSVLGLSYLEGGDQSAAIERLEQALELARRLSLRRREGVELHNLGECYFFLQRYDEALARSRQALSIFLEIHDRGTEGDVRVNIGRTLRAQGNPGQAREELGLGLELAKKTGRNEYVGLARLELGHMHAEAGRERQALDEYNEARDLFAAMDSLYLWRAELALARLARSQGRPEDTMRHAKAAETILTAQRRKLGTSMSDEGLTTALDLVQSLLD